MTSTRRADTAASEGARNSLGQHTDTDWNITTGVGYTALAVAAGRAMEAARPDALITDAQASAFVAAAQRDGTPIPLPSTWPPDTADMAASLDVGADEVHQLWETLTTYMGVRSKYFDEYVREACHEAGITQVVILAAGLDTRAHRLDLPDGTDLYEIDHPNVLTFKDQVLAEQDAKPACSRHPIGVDLRDDWPTALREAGFDPTAPTAWLAEGLLFYLPDDAKELLCQRVQRLSAVGSQWAIESMADPRGVMSVLQDNTMLRRVAGQLGTDPTGLWPAEQEWEPYPWLVRNGWSVTAASAHTVAARYGRELDGAAPMADRDHPSTLVSATYESAPPEE